MALDKDRRAFLRTAAKLGLSAGALVIFAQACSQVDSPSRSSSVLATPQSRVNPTPQPRVTPTAQPRVTPTRQPRVTPTRQPRVTPTAQPRVTSTPVAYPTATPRIVPDPVVESTATAEPTVISTPHVTTPAPDDSSITDQRVRMGHLLRRAGFGASRQEIDRFLDMGEEKTVSFLLEYDQVDDSDVDMRLAALNLDPLDHSLKDLQRMALIRMIYTQRPLQEKMVLFWHGLLTSGYKKVGRGPYMLNQDELFRRHALSPYDGLLKAVAKDPAMMIWLDSRVNKKNKPNENFARELMELFSMGVGTFTEFDVKEAARSFTGWSLRKKEFFFEENQHDFGQKTFLGITGNHDGTDIVDIVMGQPITSQFISGKLFEFFAYENPEQEVLAELASTFNATGYSIKAVVEKILPSDEFYSKKAYRAKIKSPAELVAGTVRTLGIETHANNFGSNYVTPMGQELFNPFDVSGWPEGGEWINSSTLLNRLNFVNAVSKGNKRAFDYDLVTSLKSNNIKSTEEAVDYLLDLCLDSVVPDQERAVFVGYLNGLVGGDNSVNALNKSRLGSLMYLVMSSPDYQLG